MTQQVFAQFIEMSPATLSSIFNGRTNPTMNVVGAIKKKIPNISTDWLMFGTGNMYLDDQTGQGSGHTSDFSGSSPSQTGGSSTSSGVEQILDFDMSPQTTPPNTVQTGTRINSVKSTHPEIVRESLKVLDKPPRRVIEIRVFYDDQTWDTFVPSKK